MQLFTLSESDIVVGADLGMGGGGKGKRRVESHVGLGSCRRSGAKCFTGLGVFSIFCFPAAVLFCFCLLFSPLLCGAGEMVLC